MASHTVHQCEAAHHHRVAATFSQLSSEQKTPRNLVVTECLISVDELTKTDLSREEKQQLRYEAYRLRTGAKILQEYQDMWMNELFEGLEEEEPNEQEEEERDEVELSQPIVPDSDFPTPDFQVSESVQTVIADRTQASELYGNIQAMSATIPAFNDTAAYIAALSSPMTTCTEERVIVRPHIADKIFHGDRTRYEVVIYAGPGSGKSTWNDIKRTDDSVTVNIPDTDFMSDWKYKPSVIITNMPHLLKYAAVGIALIPSREVWEKRLLSKGCTPKSDWYDGMLCETHCAKVKMKTDAYLSVAISNYRG